MSGWKPSKKYKRIAEGYLCFIGGWDLDCSDNALREMFEHETYGKPVEANNGYYQGKKWQDVMRAMWKEDIRNGNLSHRELFEDNNIPGWIAAKALGVKGVAKCPLTFEEVLL